jgi:hypothetical protein
VFGNTSARRLAAAELEARRRLWRDRCLDYRDNPLGYATDIIRGRLTAAQEEGLRAIGSSRRVAFKAAHAIGKTWMAAVVACWWYDCWDDHIVYITAPTWPQVLGLTFKQIKLLRRSLGLPGRIMETGYVIDEDKQRAAGHYIRALNAETGEGFQGEHTAPILIIGEEATGIPAHIFPAIDGLMTSPACKCLLIANPTDESTPFGQFCTAPREAKRWTVLTASVFDHPNIPRELECETVDFPNAVRLQWLRDMLAAECETIADTVDDSGLGGDTFPWWSVETIDDSLGGLPLSRNPAARKVVYLPNATFQGRALGLFPTMADEQVIPRNWLDRSLRGAAAPAARGGNTLLWAAVGRGAAWAAVARRKGWLPEIGCDVARHGDDRTTIVTRCGPYVTGLRETRHYDLNAVTGLIRIAVREAAAALNVPAAWVVARIDVTGGLGAGPFDTLHAEGYAVEAVNSSETAFDPEQFPNRRSELWWTVRERARTGEVDLSYLPRDQAESLRREWSAPHWKPDARGRRVVDPKAKIKERLGYSPDLADAANLAFAPSVPETVLEADPYEGERI